MLLDEIDNIGADQQRSPNGALLEVLDPEQNDELQDNYLGVPEDNRADVPKDVSLEVVMVRSLDEVYAAAFGA